jgi:hypothetical protein
LVSEELASVLLAAFSSKDLIDEKKIDENNK